MGAKPKTTQRTPAKRTPARKAKTAAAKPVRKPSGARAGATVDAYIASLTGWQKDAATRLREVIRAAAPDATEAIKWGQPVYEDNGPVCYFKVTEESLGGFVRQAVDLNRRLGNPNVRGESAPEREAIPAPEPESEEPDLAALVVPVDPALSDDSNGIRDESSY